MAKDSEHPLSELISIAAKAGIGLLPGGGLLTAGYEGLQLLGKQAAAQMERRSQKRYEEFIENVFDGKITPETTEHLTADDYTALLSGCMADMENEKAKYYGRLAAAIGRGEIKGSSRRFMIMTLSQFSEHQLQMLRKSDIASRFDLKPTQGNGSLDAVEILQLSDPVHKHEYAELVARSMYLEGELTPLGQALVRACFDTAELMPSAIGYRSWFAKYVDIIYDSNQVSLIHTLINGFANAGIRSSNRVVSVTDRVSMAQFASPRIMIVGSEGVPDYLAVLKARLKNNDILFVCLEDHSAAIKEHYPDSTILNVDGWSNSEIFDEVLKYITSENGLV
ncbi:MULTISPECIES: hypothetical protein [Pseudomonas]|uniref:SIR2-like domain-containing protein n=1 Tax=Pseudomonas capeferrum TaxID=1495066 RepID=A0ABY7R685_9PSED|nr:MULTISPECIES: hypothetical protein [Pseudomonas]MUT50479.1 hypothetical protein [Pseudomonas sp. TDA1]WCH99269.1 hypothetical protein PMC74_21245 [Pseudomonas capeferrum]